MAPTRRRRAVSKPDPPASEEEEKEVEEEEEEASESREGGEEEEKEEEEEDDDEKEKEKEGDKEGVEEGEEARPVLLPRSTAGKFARYVWSEADEIRILTALVALEKRPTPKDLEPLFAEMKSSFPRTVSESSFKDKVRRMRTKYTSIYNLSPEEKVLHDLALKVWGSTARKRSMTVEAPSFSVLLDQDEEDLRKEGGCLRPSKLKKFQEAWSQLRAEATEVENKRLSLKTEQTKAIDRARKRARKL